MQSENSKYIKIAPSILSADFSRLGEQVAEVSAAGADYIHIDVMDGQFVPNITIGAPVVKAIRPHTKLPLDVHLMIENPESRLSSFVEAGADIITIHVETCPHVYRVIQSIKEYNVRAGISLNPGSPLELITEILPLVDIVLVMTVNPGFGGQKFISGMVNKITTLRQIMDRQQYQAELEVDGGITTLTAPIVAKAGATVLVAGTAIFGATQGIRESLRQIKDCLQ